MRKSRLGNGVLEYDEDGDLILDRSEEGTILIGTLCLAVAEGLYFLTLMHKY
jgi:hypothetical protein